MAHRDNCLNFVRAVPGWPGQSQHCLVQLEELLYLRQCETQFLVSLNKDHALEISRLVRTVTRSSSRRSRQQTFSLVKPDCLDIYLRAASQLTDMHLNTVNIIPENMAR